MSSSRAEASRRFHRFPRTWLIQDRTHDLAERTWVMGVLNVTPDSFSDGGTYIDPGRGVDRALEMAALGADVVDIGGESTRPGSDPVSPEDQWRRIGPVLRSAARQTRCPLSVDTTSALVAARALESGARIINDVSSLGDPGMAKLAAESGAGLILVHAKGRPKSMQIDPRYDDLLGEIRSFLELGIGRALENGVKREQIVVDPGIGFGKTLSHNLELIARLTDLDALERPLLVGASRKSFLGKILDLPVTDRLEGSLAAHVAAVLAGAHVVRAHDVKATVRAVRVADALLSQTLETDS